MQYYKIVFVISLLIGLTISFSRCLHIHSLVNSDPRGAQYAGSKSCISCHSKISGTYAHSNHYKTSSKVNYAAGYTDAHADDYTAGHADDHVADDAADHADLKKLFAGAGDRFYFGDSSYIRIEENDDGLLQSYFVHDEKKTSGQFDIAFGSAEKAQTYGYWKEDRLYQLPLTYFTSGKIWANSPGFPAGHANFGRAIVSRCFECHASFVDKAFVQTGALAVSENLDRNSIVYGIDCERCHGPALQHVNFQQENPSVKTAGFIVPIKSLSRQQQLDVCSVCHAGNDRSTQRSLFAFMPGDTLSHFYFPDFGMSSKEPDVHGKQLQLLESSMCFIKSGMTCTTCHAIHGPERDQMAVFISTCMDCHSRSVHAITVLKENEQRKRDFNLAGLNCIDCHMPLQTSKIIHFDSGGGLRSIPYLLRTHKIAIYK